MMDLDQAMGRIRTRRGRPGGLAACVALSLLLLAGAAQPATLGGAATPLDMLAAALDDRIEAIGNTAQPTKALKKEASGLRKALLKLDQYSGAGDTPDLKRLVASAANIFKSRSEDPGVLASVGALRNALDGHALQARSLVKLEQELLSQAPTQDKLEQALQLLDTLHESGLQAWPDHFGKGAKKLAAAVSKYRKLLTKAQKARLKESKKFKNDLLITDARVVSGETQIAHPVAIETTLRIEQPTPQVVLTYRAIFKADVDSGATTARQCVLGDVTLQDVPIGTSTHMQVFTIPTECELPGTQQVEPLEPGDYYLVVEVDPHDSVIERLDAESELNNVFIDQTSPMTLDDQFKDVPNIVLASAEIDPPFILTTPGGEPDSNVGLNVQVSTSGSEVVSGVPFKATMVVLLLVDGVPFTIAIDALYWDENVGTYVESFVLPDLVPGQLLNQHIEVSFPFDPPGDLEDQIIPAQIVVQLNHDGSIAEFEPDGPDNVVQLEAGSLGVVMLEECSFVRSYAKSMGNSDIGASVAFRGALDITADPDLFPVQDDQNSLIGCVASASAGLDVDLLGFDIDLLGFGGLLERDPVQDYGYFGTDLEFLGQVLYSVSIDTPMLEALPPEQLPEGLSVIDGGFCFSKELGGIGSPLSKSVSKTGYFFPGGVPVFVTGKIEGGIGFEIGLKGTDALTMTAGPFLDLKAVVEGGVGVCPACAGAGGELTLIKDTFRTIAGTGMTVVDGVDDNGDDARSILASQCFRVQNEIEMLDGRLFVFAEVPLWCDTCWNFFGVPYPCNCGPKRWELDIVNWPGFFFTQELQNVTNPKCCIRVTGLPLCDDLTAGETICLMDTPDFCNN